MEKKDKEYHIRISANNPWFKLNLKEVWQYRDLIVLFTKKAFTVKYKQTILGPLWLFIGPIFSCVVYTVLFGRIAGLSTEGVPRLLFYLTSNAIWGFFSNCLNANTGTFVENARLFGKVYFPRLSIPVSRIFTSLIQFAIQMVLVIAFLVYYYFKGEVHPNLSAFYLIPIVLLQLGALGMGVGILISSLTTKYRDLYSLFGFGFQLWMYATPVVYPMSQIKEPLLRKFILINPVSMSMEAFRYVFLGVGHVDARIFILSCAFTLVMLTGGIMIFNRVERTFMDTV